MTPLEYAALCCYKFTLFHGHIKGRGHLPRTRLDRKNRFHRLLPQHKIVEGDGSRDSFHAHWYTATAIYDAFMDDLLAAGIDITTGQIISEEHWTAAQALVRLTGQPYDGPAALKLSHDVRDLQERRADAELAMALRMNLL